MFFRAKAASRLIDVLFEARNLLGQSLLAFGKLLFFIGAGSSLAVFRQFIDALGYIVLPAHRLFGALSELLNVLLPACLLRRVQHTLGLLHALQGALRLRGGFGLRCLRLR